MNEYAYVVNVDAALVRDGRYLLIERSQEEEHAAGQLAFPGGKVEQAPGDEDTIETTAVRELREEVGVEVSQIEYVCSNTFETDDGTQCLNVVTLCQYADGDAHPRATDEVAAVHWLSSEEIEARTDVPPYLDRFVEQIEEKRSVE